MMLSNGPGNPEDIPEVLDMIRGVQGKFRFLVSVWDTNYLALLMVLKPIK